MLYKTIDEMKQATRWTPDGPTQFDSAKNYCGEHPTGYVVVVGRNRDSDTLTNCNFDVALDHLGGESERPEEGFQAVRVARFGHWACGWYELILVHESATDKLEIAREILNSLHDYPVLDEDAWSEQEWEEQSETLDAHADEFRRELLKYCEFKNSDREPRGKRGADIAEIVDRVYRDDCSNSGEGWVTAESIARYFAGSGKWDIPRMAKEGNRFARALISCGFVTSVKEAAG